MKRVSGDLIKMFKANRFDVIIHGCNCFHVMGAGIAGQIAWQFPEAVTVDLLTKKGDYQKLSNWSAAYLENGKIIINLYTQYLPGRDLNINALLLGFEKLVRHFIGPNVRVGIPAIGCGIAGGNWDNIYPALKAITEGLDFTYVAYEKEEEEIKTITLEELLDNGDNKAK